MVFWEKNRAVSLIFTILFVIEIYHFSSITGGVGGGNVWVARSYHFIVFFLFSFFSMATIKGKTKLKRKYILIVLTLSIIQAILDETHQIFVPFRDASIQDVLTDTLGIFSSIIFYVCTQSKKTKL